MESVAKDWLLNFSLFEPLFPILASLGPGIQPPDVAKLNNIIDVNNFTIQQEASTDAFEDGYEARIFFETRNTDAPTQLA